jgi:hypothetical protein
MATLFDIFKAYDLIKSGNVESLRSMVERADVYIAVEGDDGSVRPAGLYWQTGVGLFYLRLLAIEGLKNDKLNIMQYVCGERGVHPLADDPDAYGKDSCLIFAFVSRFFRPSLELPPRLSSLFHQLQPSH